MPANRENQGRGPSTVMDEQQQADTSQPQAESPPPEALRRSRGFLREHPVKALILFIVLVAAAIGAYMVWQYMQTYEATDDAQIDGHLNAVSTRVAGTVIGVYVVENQPVKAGQLMVELDPRDYKVALDRAQANVAQAQAQVRAESPTVPITVTSSQTRIATSGAGVANAQAGVAAAERDLEAQRARIAQAEANDARAQADLKRYSELVSKDEVSREEYDQRVAAAKAAAANVDAERAAAAALERGIEQRRAGLDQARSELNQARSNAPQQLAAQRATIDLRRAGVAVARTATEEAALNLEYTRIFAPVAGIVGRKNVEVGQRVAPGQQLIAVVPLEDIWVTANFKENQVRHLRVNQRATIHVDAFDRDYDGYVESLPPASSARFSVLPPENASGNYVKVVQRLPVRLRFKPDQDSNHELRPGMSVVPKVWIR
jgi:membrane fusion protein, multidrug efflux system